MSSSKAPKGDALVVEVDVTGYRETSMALPGNPHSKFTAYDIHVKCCGLKWRIQRRYNDFRHLHERMSKVYTQVSSFKFPPKSRLTFTRVTKDRRREAFDQYLKLLCRITPPPKELLKFLEVDSLIADDSSVQAAKLRRKASIVANEEPDVEQRQHERAMKEVLNHVSRLQEDKVRRALSSYVVLTGATVALASWFLRVYLAYYEQETRWYHTLVVIASWFGLLFYSRVFRKNLKERVATVMAKMQLQAELRLSQAKGKRE